jgi:outer membrane lipopolysaccharide assembly protein LptE/RlpB
MMHDSATRSLVAKTLPPILLLAALLGLGACTSPCDRINAQMRQLNADTIRDPNIAVDGRYLSEFQELAAQSVERGCLAVDE